MLLDHLTDVRYDHVYLVQEWFSDSWITVFFVHDLKEAEQMANEHFQIDYRPTRVLRVEESVIVKLN